MPQHRTNPSCLYDYRPEHYVTAEQVVGGGVLAACGVLVLSFVVGGVGLTAAAAADRVYGEFASRVHTRF